MDGFIERLAERAEDSGVGRFVELVRLGWNSYSFIFYIGGVSAILGGLFGVAGWVSVIVTVLFFYYAGRFKKHLDAERGRRERTRRH